MTVTDLLNIEVWTQNEERFVCIYKKKTRVFFSKILWSQFTSYCDEKLKKNEKGIKQFGKKKTVNVSDVVNIITTDIPAKNILLDAYEWTNLMKVQEKVKNILNNKEEHYMLSENTTIHARKPTEHNVNVWAVFEKTHVKGGNKLYMSDKALKHLLNYTLLINECIKNCEEDKFQLESMTFVDVIKVDSNRWYISLLRKDEHGIGKKVFNLTVNEWKELEVHLPSILEVLQPDLVYSWCYTLEGVILDVSNRAFTNEERCVFNAEHNFPSYYTSDEPGAPTPELHINTYPFAEYPCQQFIPRFKWKHMLRNNTVLTDYTWYMYKESCRRKGLHADSCEKGDKLIVHEQGGKPLVIDLQKEVVNDLKYSPFAALTVYNFLLEAYITRHMHPNEDWNLTITNHVLNAQSNVNVENFMYVCGLVGILLTLDEAMLIVKTKDVNLKENVLLECYRLTIKESMQFDWS